MTVSANTVEKIEPPVCPYCGGISKLIDTEEIYGRSYGYAWACEHYPQCDAYVGVHTDTTQPLGRLANPALRKAKTRAHRVFDPLWRDAPRCYTLEDEASPEHRESVRRIRKAARRRAYAWLANELGIERDDCHIGFFTVDQCDRTVEICRDACPELILEWARGRGE